MQVFGYFSQVIWLRFIVEDIFYPSFFVLHTCAYLCLCYHPEPLLSVGHSPVAVSGVERWLSALLVVKTATGSLHQSVAGGSVWRPDQGLRCWKKEFFVISVIAKKLININNYSINNGMDTIVIHFQVKWHFVLYKTQNWERSKVSETLVMIASDKFVTWNMTHQGKNNRQTVSIYPLYIKWGITLTSLLTHGLVLEEAAKYVNWVLTHRWKWEVILQHL